MGFVKIKLFRATRYGSEWVWSSKSIELTGCGELVLFYKWSKWRMSWDTYGVSVVFPSNTGYFPDNPWRYGQSLGCYLNLWEILRKARIRVQTYLLDPCLKPDKHGFMRINRWVFLTWFWHVAARAMKRILCVHHASLSQTPCRRIRLTLFGHSMKAQRNEFRSSNHKAYAVRGRTGCVHLCTQKN